MIIEGLEQFTDNHSPFLPLGNILRYEARVAKTFLKAGPIEIRAGDPCYLIHVKTNTTNNSHSPKTVFLDLPRDFQTLSQIIKKEEYLDTAHVLGISTSMIGKIAARYGLTVLPADTSKDYEEMTRSTYEKFKDGRPYKFDGMIVCYSPAAQFVERFGGKND